MFVYFRTLAFVHAVSDLTGTDLSNVRSLGSFVRAIHLGIDELLLFRHPDVDLEKKSSRVLPALFEKVV